MVLCTFIETHKLCMNAEKLLAKEHKRLYNPARKQVFKPGTEMPAKS